MKTWMKRSLIGMVALFGLAAPAMANAEEPCPVPAVQVQPVGYFGGGARGGFRGGYNRGYAGRGYAGRGYVGYGRGFARAPRWERRGEFRRGPVAFGRGHYRRW